MSTIAETKSEKQEFVETKTGSDRNTVEPCVALREVRTRYRQSFGAAARQTVAQYLADKRAANRIRALYREAADIASVYSVLPMLSEIDPDDAPSADEAAVIGAMDGTRAALALTADDMRLHGEKVPLVRDWLERVAIWSADCSESTFRDHPPGFGLCRGGRA